MLGSHPGIPKAREYWRGPDHKLTGTEFEREMWAEILDFGLAKVIRDPARCREARCREERCRAGKSFERQ
jgi:hypothetical protein